MLLNTHKKMATTLAFKAGYALEDYATTKQYGINRSTLMIECKEVLGKSNGTAFLNIAAKYGNTGKMRYITQNGLNLIKRCKGFSWAAYFCPAGYPAIGYGRIVKDDEDFSASIDETQAEELLRQDTMIAGRAILRLINVPLTDGQFDALVSFTYNLDGGTLQCSTLHCKTIRAEVPEQLMRWVWAGGVN